MLYLCERDPVPTVQEIEWAPGPVWTGAENLAAHRDSIPAHFPSSTDNKTDLRHMRI